MSIKPSLRFRPYFLLTSVLIALAGTLGGCSDDPGRSCVVDRDCFIDEKCVAGQCGVVVVVSDAGEEMRDGDSDAEGSLDVGDGGHTPDTSIPDTSIPDAQVSDTPDTSDEDVADADADADVDSDVGELPEPGDFSAQCVLEEPSIFSLTAQAVAIAPDGGMHLAAGGDAVRYARRVNGSWQTTLVDHGDGVALTIDGEGDPILAYFDNSERRDVDAIDVEKLKVARHKNGAWQIETLATLPRFAEDNNRVSIAVADNGSIFLAHFAGGVVPTQRNIIFREFDGQQWRHETALPTTQYIKDLYVAATADGDPIVAYHRDTFVSAFEGVFAVRVNGEWTTTTMTTSSRNVPLTGFFATDGRPAFVGTTKGGANNQYVDVYLRNAGAWVHERCRSPESRDALTATIVNDTRIEVANVAYSSTSQKWSVNLNTLEDEDCTDNVTGGVWDRNKNTRSINDWGPIAELGKLSFAARGQGRLVSYYDSEDRALKVARSTDGGGTWSIDTVWSLAIHGVAPALTLDPDGHPIVASVEALEGAVWISEWDGNAWSKQRVPMGEGCFAPALHEGAIDLDLATNGDLRVVFTEQCGSSFFGSTIVFARRTPQGAWHRQTVVTASENYPGLKLGETPSGVPALAITNGGQQITYALFTGVDWSLSLIPRMDGQGSRQVHGRPALLHATNGRPALAWLQNYPYQLVYADRDPITGWNQTIVTTTRSQSSPALAWDGANTPHLASIAQNSTGAPHLLRYGYLESASWNLEEGPTLATGTQPTTPRGLDLAMTGEDNPAVAAYDARYGKLTLHHHREGLWWSSQLASPGDHGWMPSLAITPAGKAAVAHFHRSAGALCVEALDLP